MSLGEVVSSRSRAVRSPGALFEWAYGRLGPGYPRAAVIAVLQLAHVNVVFGVLGISLFTDMSAGDFWRIVLVGIAGMFVYNLVYLRVATGLLEPVGAWIAGARDQAGTVAAWKACASFPRDMLKRDWTSRLQGTLSYVGLLLWAGYVAWVLGIEADAAIALGAGVFVFILYVQSLRFFALEQALRPVLSEIAAHAIDEAELRAPGLSLRTRLLTALPAINVITAVVAVGITGYGHHLDLSDLALAVLVATVIAGTLSLTLTLLLADSITAPVAALHDATERVGRGDFGARVKVVTTDETGGLSLSFNEMAAGLEQRERLREAFGTFVDPDLAERVLDEGTDLAGEEVEVSLLFMDIRGFTSYSEQAEAHEVVARLNDLYAQVVPAILREGGNANKFIGDGLLAVFGAPNRLDDHAGRAVAAGLEITRIVRERYDGELCVGVGINSGRVVVGTIGGGGRLDFTVIGDAVNTAARVESATRETGDDLLITDETRRRLSGDGSAWVERPAIALKGKARQVSLYAPE